MRRGVNMFDLVPFRRRGLSKRDDFFDRMESFFNDQFKDYPQIFKGELKVDLKEASNEYIVDAELPGVKKEDIEVTYKNNYLTISAKREEIVNEEKENYIRKERSYGKIERSIYADDIDEANIKAKFENGVLKLTVPKKIKTEGEKGNKISIE